MFGIADSVAPDGAALLGLGYGSDADSQDSHESGRAQKLKATNSKAEAAEQGSRASPAALSTGDKVAAGGDGASQTAGGWIKGEEVDQRQAEALLSFSKGQR